MQSSSGDATITLGVCSDTHFWFNGPNFEGESLQLQGHSELLFETLLNQVGSAGLDAFIHLGDMTSGGGSFEMPADEFRKTLQKASNGFQGLNTKTFALPGNHDCIVGDSWSHFGDIWSLERGLGRTVDIDHVRLVLLNAQGHNNQQIHDAKPADPVYGWISDEEMTRLEEALETAQDKRVILFIHQLLKPWALDKPWKAFYGVLNHSRVTELLEKYGNVRAIFQGHAHRYDVQTCTAGTGECTYVVLPAVIEYPLGWLKLCVGLDAIDVSLQLLPLETLAELSRTSGNGQTWRVGKQQWQNFSIGLV